MAIVKLGEPSLDIFLMYLIEQDSTKSVVINKFKEDFPHIYRRISHIFGSPECNGYLDSLNIDSRGGRQGFPFDIFFLISLIHRENQNYYTKQQECVFNHISKRGN